MRPILTVLLCLSLSADSFAQVADAVYTNGKIYTVNNDRPWAEAVAINDGEFIKVGSIAKPNE